MDKFVCENCFDDYAVVEFIRLEVVEDKCDYCETDSSSEAIAAPIREVARFIRDGIETEWADPADEAVPWDSEEDRYIVTTYDSYDLLEKVLSIDSDDLRWDIVHYLGDGDWCQKTFLQADSTGGMVRRLGRLFRPVKTPYEIRFLSS